MKINTSKTMEIVIDFSKGKTLKASLPNIIMDGNIIERTESAKLLEVNVVRPNLEYPCRSYQARDCT